MIVLMVLFFSCCALKIYQLWVEHQHAEECEEPIDEPIHAQPTRYSIADDPTISDTAKIIALLCEQERREKEAVKRAKQEATQADMMEDIDMLEEMIAEKQLYSEFLREERNKCTRGSEGWHKWNNKMLSVRKSVYQIRGKINKMYAQVG